MSGLTAPVAAPIAVEDLGVAVRGRWLLRNVDLRVGPGEIVAMAGPNGAGKSTLLRAMAGDVAAAEGRVLIDGRPVGSYRAHELALRRAVLPQQTVLQFAFTAREVVELGRGPRRGDGDAMAVAASLAKTDTLHVAERDYPSLSGGEQARVSLARVLAQESPILLLDEPTAALDLRHQRMVMEVARRTAAAGGSVVVVLHDLNIAATYADRIVLLCGGRIVADGPPWQTMREPLLTEVFDCPITVIPHPVSGAPLILPIAGQRLRPEPPERTGAVKGRPGDP